MSKKAVYADDPLLGRMKQCSKCGEYWPLDIEFFHPLSAGNDGFQGQCRACRKEYYAGFFARKRLEASGALA
jgi:hypothetical protein